MTAIETCANCDRPIGKFEQCYLWNNMPVCHACNQTLRAQNAVKVDEISKSAAKQRADSHQAIGAAIAVSGAVTAAIAYKMIDPRSASVGIHQAFEEVLFWIGVVMICVGALWFAAGRVMSK